MAQATVRLDAGVQARITMRDHVVYADEPTDAGGMNTGATPMELLVGALGACSAITCKMYAERKGWALESVEIELDLERVKKADVPTYTGTSEQVNVLHKRMVFVGDLNDDQKKRLAEIATKCPVHKVLQYPTLYEDLIAETVEQELILDAMN